jgi:hypothetical protein
MPPAAWFSGLGEGTEIRLGECAANLSGMRVGPPEVFGAVVSAPRRSWCVTWKARRRTEVRLAAGLPYLRLGQGPPLVMALGGAAEHASPRGAGRRMSLVTAARFAGHFTVYVTSRKPGLVRGATVADIAVGYANAIGEELGGLAVGLQLAIGYPHLVRRLVLAAAACRLSPSGRHRSQPRYLPRTERTYRRFRTAGQLTQISTCPALCVPSQGGDGGPLTLCDNHGPG